MRRFLQLVARANLGALATLLVLLLALLARGANDSSRAALLVIVLLVMLLVAVACSSGANVARVVGSNTVGLLAGLAFALVSVASTIPGILPPHPLFALANVAPAPASLAPFRTYEGLAAFLAPLAAYGLGCFSSTDSSARDRTGRWLVLFALVYALIALKVFFQRAPGLGARLDAQIGSANGAATVFGTVGIFSLVMLARGAAGRLGETAVNLPKSVNWARTIFVSPVSFASLGLSVACLLLTASRGGSAAFLVGALVFGVALMLGKRLRLQAVLGPSLALFAISVLFLLWGGDLLVARLQTAELGDAGRQQLVEQHWRAFLERPLIGHGLDTFHDVQSVRSAPEQWTAVRSAGAAHNVFLQLLEETGLIGFSLIGLLFVAPLSRAFARIAQGRSGVEWAAGAIAATALVLLHGWVDFGLQIPAMSSLYAFCLGAAVGTSASGA